MVTAFILANVQGRRVGEIAAYLETMKGVSEVHLVAGEYDVVAVARVPDNASLSELITEQLVHAPGVERTKTLISLEELGGSDAAELSSKVENAPHG